MFKLCQEGRLRLDHENALRNTNMHQTDNAWLIGRPGSGCDSASGRSHGAAANNIHKYCTPALKAGQTMAKVNLSLGPKAAILVYTASGSVVHFWLPE